MPLVNSPALAPKKLAANRANAQLWRGPIGLEGLIRMRDRKINHGAYVQDKEEALGTLGEEPKDFYALRRVGSILRQVGRHTDLLLRLKREPWHAENPKKNIENEAESHDVIDNKGSNFLSHDVYEK